MLCLSVGMPVCVFVFRSFLKYYWLLFSESACVHASTEAFISLSLIVASCFIFKTASCTKADFNDIDKYIVPTFGVYTLCWSAFVPVYVTRPNALSFVCRGALCAHIMSWVFWECVLVYFMLVCIYIWYVCTAHACVSACVCVFLPSSKVSDTIINITGAFFLLCLLEISI